MNRLFLLILLGTSASAQPTSIAPAIDAYIQPYVATNNFSGQILVRRGSQVLYEKSFGDADRERHPPITPDTRFHVASMSMQLTAAAVMRLVDEGKLSLDTRVIDIVPSVRGGERITIRNLLEQRSGLSDINSRPDYNEILQHPQTPASLVATIANDTLLFEPGTRYFHEEHSAYNLLALIIERKTGLAFPNAMQRLLFTPAGMTHSATDDDANACSSDAALGYAPLGVAELTVAQRIYWSAKAGNASACTTARDVARFADSLFHGALLSAGSRTAVLDTAGPPVGYGWFRRQNSRFGEFAYYMNGRAPGFASFVLHLPREDLTVVALSNIYSSATTDIGNDIAAIALGLPYKQLQVRTPLLPADSLALDSLKFTFPANFYQPNATLAFVKKGAELFLRWPSGDLSPLIPLDRDHLIDRAYWVPVGIVRDERGVPRSITYDRFEGARAN
ncbi:MAG TPA: serine hydrolase domain-containing protein [Gemmatimonadaceae bacterium]|nr:serine hydrolase domain-containing protein [Gemmatimonadaceae bacterium]